jgi:hypothetical protein
VRRKSILFLLALLAVTTQIGAQEDLDNADLESLLQDENTSTINEVPTEATENTAIESAPTEGTGTSETPSLDDLSSDTVDLDSLEPVPSETEKASNDVVGEEPVTEAPPAAPADDVITTDSPLDTLEPLPTEEPVPEVAAPEKSNDDLESITKDLGTEAPATEVTETAPAPEEKPNQVAEKKPLEPEVFDVGREERELLSLAQKVTGQISNNEWNEVATAAKVDTYTVVKDDWLFKISKRLFGTGFYYPKIWSLNSFITNPHFIEPGMVLSFTTGSGSAAPEVKLGTFTEDELNSQPGVNGTGNVNDLANFGEDAKPAWVDEKSQLENQGVYFQYASEETMDDLAKASEAALNREYENYEPPRNEFDVVVPKNYDNKTGFDRNSRIFYSVKEGFYLSTFISTNIVQDFGSITNGPDENIYFVQSDRAYVQFDETMNVLPGDKFSVYSSGGKVKHPNSDREGYKYSIVGQIKVIRKIRDKWEVVFEEVSGTPQRGDRITAYTPKIDRITQTYNSRLVEAAILASYQPMQSFLSFGDVVYIDRGRADGVEMGNVFEIFGFKDRSTKKNITDQPTYKMGELTVITLTDNFATALVTNSTRDFYPGDIAITKTKESILREAKAKSPSADSDGTVSGKALEELDVELNLENLNDDLLKQADKIQLTEDELAELERQEREKSVIKDSERDLKALERLENEIEHAEKILNDAKLDEDKLLENENLNDLEKKNNTIEEDSLDEIEENLGKRYIDEDLNSKDNPFGLTEFDVEEVDELLNVEKKENQ